MKLVEKVLKMFVCSRQLLVLGLLLTGLGLPTQSWGQWTNNPSANTPISTVSVFDGPNIRMVSDGSGGAIISWSDYRNGGGSDIYAQRINASGVVQWTANGVPICVAAGSQLYPVLVGDGVGGAIITWSDGRGNASRIYAQRISASGVAQWAANGISISGGTGSQTLPAIVSDGGGGAIIAWEDSRNDTAATGNVDIYAQRVTGAGIGQWGANGVAICTAAFAQSAVAICSNGANGAIIAWADYRNGGQNTDVYAQGVSAAGVVPWTVNGVVICRAPDFQTNIRNVPDGIGGAIIVWSDRRNANDYDIYGQRVNSSGAVQWTANGAQLCVFGGDQTALQAVPDGAGGVVVGWTDSRAGGVSNIYAQRVNSAGAALWTSNGVPVAPSPAPQFESSLVPDGIGGAIVTWSDGRPGQQYDIYTQKLNSLGELQWNAGGVVISNAADNQITPALVNDGAGGAIMAWDDERSQTNSAVFAQNIDQNGNLGTFRIVTSTFGPGSISPSGIVLVPGGANQTMTMTPNTGCHVDSVVVDGVNAGSVGAYTFTNVTANHTIAAYFSINQYTISASATGPGTINPSGSITVVYGDSISFAIIPDNGARIDSVNVDGQNLGAIAAYTFQSVAANHAILAYFSIVQVSLQVNFTGDTLVGNGQSISVDPPPGFRTTDAWLYYRLAGRAAYDSLRLDTAIVPYRGQIPSSAVTIRGLEYYIALTGTVSAGGQLRITAPGTNPEASPFVVQVKVGSVRSPATLAARTYKMVSVPLLANWPDIGSVLFDDLGAYDDRRWRLFRWNGNSYTEYPNLSDVPFSPGTAFWLISNTATSFDVDSGRSVSSAAPYVVRLDTGWNQVANPFAFSVAWGSVADSNMRGPYYFNGTDYELSSVLIPWEGYFVLNRQPFAVNLSFPPVEAGVSVGKMEERHDGEFVLQLSAEVPNTSLRDRHNFLGLIPDATEGEDQYDFPKPPSIGQSVHLSIMDGQRQFIRNFKPASGEGQRWDVQIGSDVPVHSMTVTLVSSGSLPDGFQCFVFDCDNFNVVPLPNNSFVVSDVGRGVRTFRIVLGTPEYAKDNSGGIPLVPMDYALDQNFPNPFNPTTTITYRLAERSDVRLEIFSLLGQLVKTLVNEEQLTGSHSALWTGENDAGRLVASGVYVCRLRAGEFSASRKLLMIR